VREYYDRRAPTYDDWYLGRGIHATRDAASWDADLAGLTGAIAALDPRATLDVACGTGFLTRHLPGEVTGLDQSDAMLAVARGHVPAARFVRGEAFALPFDDASFGRVFTGHFYGHLDGAERAAFLAETARVAPELVVVDAVARPDHALEEIQQREVDGGTWRVLKRYFSPASLLGELGGSEVVYAGPWFVMVRRAW
jgi:ubiquinone/menaquinone biosynthesis C-methylase UbiE